MNKKILIIILTFILITTGTYYKPITAHATITSAGIGTYTASKVFVALLAIAGVAVKSSDIEFIWDDGGLNTEALINNMMTYSRDLGLAMRNILSLGTAGASTLLLQRNIWNLFKGWAREKYGTDTTVSTDISTVNKEIKPLEANTYIQNSYIVNGQIGWTNIKVNTDVIVFRFSEITGENILPWAYTYYFVPTEAVMDGSVMWNSLTLEMSGYNNGASKSSYRLSNELGWCVSVSYGTNHSNLFESFESNKSYYDLGQYNSSTLPTMVTLVSQYRSSGELEQTDTITGKPVVGLQGEAATIVGQDVIGFDNTATQEENEDVVIEGPLSVALPTSEKMEELLKQLAEQEITYQEFVQALALQAVDTKTETKSQVEAKQQAITVNPSNGVYTVSLDDLFPFCIPFDIYDMLNCLKAEPEAPEVEISLPIGYDGNDFTWEEYTISLEAFDTVAQVGRIFWYILFCIGLMLLTRKLIEG